MAKQNINTLKNWFKTGLKPTQQHFWDWIDSYRHKDDKVPHTDIDGLTELLAGKVDKKDVVTPEVWNPEEPYIYNEEAQQYVSYVNPESIEPIYRNEGFYRLLEHTLADESPETHPAKWAYQGNVLGEITTDDVLGLTEALNSKLNATHTNDDDAHSSLFNSKVNNSEKGTANGIATLDEAGRVSAEQLPAMFNGDYNNLSNTPTTITQQQASDIEANNAKRSYPQADEYKLAGIEENATEGADWNTNLANKPDVVDIYGTVPQATIDILLDDSNWSNYSNTFEYVAQTPQALGLYPGLVLLNISPRYRYECANTVIVRTIKAQAVNAAPVQVNASTGVGGTTTVNLSPDVDKYLVELKNANTGESSWDTVNLKLGSKYKMLHKILVVALDTVNNNTTTVVRLVDADNNLLRTLSAGNVVDVIYTNNQIKTRVW